MGAHESQAMKTARALVEAGLTPYAAAKQAGITASAIYMSKWYKGRKNDKAKP